LLWQTADLADSRAEFNAGNSIATSTAIMAITTRSSIKVKPRRLRGFGFSFSRLWSSETRVSDQAIGLLWEFNRVKTFI